MGRLNISKSFDASRILATDAGKQLQDLIGYLGQFTEQVISTLKGGLNFSDNFNCLEKSYSLIHATPTTISTGGKKPSGIIPLRVIAADVPISSFGWWIDDRGSVVVKVSFDLAPTAAKNVVLLILF